MERKIGFNEDGKLIPLDGLSFPPSPGDELVGSGNRKVGTVTFVGPSGEVSISTDPRNVLLSVRPDDSTN